MISKNLNKKIKEVLYQLIGISAETEEKIKDLTKATIVVFLGCA
jgi:hypothetical protein